MISCRSLVSVAALVWSLGSLEARVVGSNSSPSPLTEERISALPSESRLAWSAYLERSRKARETDMAFLTAEVKAAGLAQPLVPAKARNSGLPLDKPEAWYGGKEARSIAEVVVSFQTPSGGWGKNTLMTGKVRRPGEHFVGDNSGPVASPVPPALDNDHAPADHWSYVGTIDNGATVDQLRFLAKVLAACGESASPSHREAYLRGVGYLLAAQYPNGGYPQVWPLMGGYHDSITFNDGAMLAVMRELSAVATGAPGRNWLPAAVREAARTAGERALACLLACQIKDKDGLTVWCQQHDMLTLTPAPARNYEMPCACAGESEEITLFLMRIPAPEPAAVNAVHAAAAWFSKVALHDVAYKGEGDAKKLVPAPGAAPLWARYYELGTNRPIFGDRDRSIHDDVNEISAERRKGYGWFGSYGKLVQDHYARWRRLN